MKPNLLRPRDAEGESTPLAATPKYRCGNLLYTKAGLFTLFSWLLWGDFCFSLMETIWPTILPLILKSEGAPNTIISLAITTIPSVLNFVMNPIISTASDRYRSKNGRRIPFLLGATPFITAFLIMLGYSREIGTFIFNHLPSSIANFSKTQIAVATICILIVCFRFFELFVNTVFWYLFKDVVPSPYMGRFLGLFRVVGSLAGALFNFFIFRFAETHANAIFFGVAVLYGTVFLSMCLNVKEGSYPDPKPIKRPGNFLATFIITFYKECTGHRIFCLVYLYTIVFYMGCAIDAFAIFMAISLGLSLGDIGTIAGAAAVAAMFLMYPMGWLVDKYHPIRVMLSAQICLFLVAGVKCIFLVFTFSGGTNFWLYAAIACFGVPITVANTASIFPMQMRIFPHERFGQFCSANAMCGAIGTMIGGVFVGLFLDTAKSHFLGENYYYRIIPVWSTVFTLLSFCVTMLIFREWKSLGGDAQYQPPIKDKFIDVYSGHRV